MDKFVIRGGVALPRKGAAQMKQVLLLLALVPALSFAVWTNSVQAGGPGDSGTGAKQPLDSEPDQLGVQLLRRLRDEAHRFAVSFHRQQRGERLARVGAPACRDEAA